MGRWVFTGALTLIALDLFTQNRAAGAAAGITGSIATIARRFMDPTVPAFPERSKSLERTDTSTRYPAPNIGGN